MTNQGDSSPIIPDLSQQQSFFFVSRRWVFNDSLVGTNQPWDVTHQVYFLNNPRRQTLAFAIPCWVAELSLKSLFDEKNYVRMVITYGQDLSRMIGSVNHFMASEKNILSRVNPKGVEWTLPSLSSLCNSLLKASYEFDQINLLRYQDPFHKSLDGHWESLQL